MKQVTNNLFSKIFAGIVLSLFFSCDSAYQVGAVDLTQKVIPRTIQNRTSNKNTFEQNMQIFLDKFVVNANDGTGNILVDYIKLFDLKGTNEILKLRENLYSQIANAKYMKFTRNKKAAFLINAYNFLTIETVIGNFYKNGVQIESIADIGPYEFWAFGSIPYTVAGQEKTLDEIEKETLRPLLTEGNGLIDARYHFTVVCAALGCPNLLKEVYSESNVQDLLEKATVNSLKGAKNLEISFGKTKVSSLFDWYGNEFISHSVDGVSKVGSIKNFLKKYTKSINLDGDLEFIEYNWKLNILK